MYRYVLSTVNYRLGKMPPSVTQTGIFSDAPRRRLGGDVPSAEPFQYIPGPQGLSLRWERKLAFAAQFSGRTADTDAAGNPPSCQRTGPAPGC